MALSTFILLWNSWGRKCVQTCTLDFESIPNFKCTNFNFCFPLKYIITCICKMLETPSCVYVRHMVVPRQSISFLVRNVVRNAVRCCLGLISKDWYNTWKGGRAGWLKRLVRVWINIATLGTNLVIYSNRWTHSLTWQVHFYISARDSLSQVQKKLIDCSYNTQHKCSPNGKRINN